MLFAGSYKKYSVVLSILIISICSGNSALSTGRDLTLRLNGSKMDREDYEKIQNIYERGVSGRTTSWSNAGSGNRYSMTPQPAYMHESTSLPCRKADITAVLDKQTEGVTIVSCRDRSGNWHIQEVTSRKKRLHQQKTLVSSSPPPGKKKHHRRKWSKPVE